MAAGLELPQNLLFQRNWVQPTANVDYITILAIHFGYC